MNRFLDSVRGERGQGYGLRVLGIGLGISFLVGFRVDCLDG